jgi:hypothetical protein
VEFAGLRNSVVVRILPQAQPRKERILLVDDPVAISTVLGFIVFRQRKEAVGMTRSRLGRVVAE